MACHGPSLQYIFGPVVSSTGNMLIQSLETLGGGHGIVVIKNPPIIILKGAMTRRTANYIDFAHLCRQPGYSSLESY